jgi:hypothetical protein
VSDLSQKKLKQLLSYDPDTGIFTWLVRAAICISVGDVAGSLHNKYWRIKIGDHQYLAHRLAWLYMTGTWPSDQIDHINGLQNDNRWSNLREATGLLNTQNQRRARRNNQTGYLGVSPKGKKFRAAIGVLGKKIRLGEFDTPQAAYQAYLVAKRKLHAGCTI